MNGPPLRTPPAAPPARCPPIVAPASLSGLYFLGGPLAVGALVAATSR